MNKALIIGVALVSVLAIGGGVLFFASSGDSTTYNVAQTPVADNTPEDLAVIPEDLSSVIETAISRQAQSRATIIDVRTKQEFDQLHATDALHWGLVEEIELGNMPPIDKDAEIYVYCRSGNRSGQAIKLMQAAGYTNLVNIGGLDDWLAAGGPTTTSLMDS